MLRFMLVGLLALSAMATIVRAADGDGPDGWRFVPQRDEVAPDASVVRDPDGAVGLVISGKNEAASDGRWVKTVPLPADAKYVTFNARHRDSNVGALARNVVASLVWMDAQGKEVAQAEYALTNGPADAQGWRAIKAIYAVPARATQAQMELRLRWAPQGKIEWRDARVEPSAPPVPRMVKIASIQHRPRNGKSAQENLDQFARLIDEAGAKKVDIVCLPEAITLIGRGANYLGSTEPIPGPSTAFLGEHAKKANTYIVAGLLEKDGKAAYNTAVLIGRDGKLVGKYRKVCLPFGESNGGLTPGNDYPVFDTDFGKVGMMICWDVSYPEVARELSTRGAEIILMPIWGGYETFCKARALENQVPLVISSYDMRSAIYDRDGEAKAIAPDKSTTIVYAEVNLAEISNLKGVGNWRDRLWMEGPPRKDSSPEAVANTAAADARAISR